MFIDRNISKYLLHEDSSVLQALKKIEDTHGRIVFITSDNNILKAVATNGDIIRWLVKEEKPNLASPVLEMANMKYSHADIDEDREKVLEKLEKVLFVPLTDKEGHILAVATRNAPSEGIFIGDYQINKYTPCYIISEIGNNHNGSIELAKRLVDASIDAGANCAKFQMRHLDELYHNSGNANDIGENLGSQYTLDLLSKFQLTNDELFEVFDYCTEKGIQPLCTPWDLKSLEKLEEYGMPAYKIASADFTNFNILEAAGKTGKSLICSTGMSSEDEIISTTEFLKKIGSPFILLHCNSTYPAPFADINLKYMQRIADISGMVSGYSGHERGISVSVAAVALGAKIIERHITLDKTMEGNDHKASLLPHEFKDMVTKIREVESSLGDGKFRELSQGEMMNRVSLAKSLIINTKLQKGETIKKEMIDIKSPGKGLQPMYINKLIGKQAKHDFESGDFFYPADIEDDYVQPRNYQFKRPWGLPVRYHDFKQLLSKTNSTLVEFHLSYKDMEVDFHKFFDTKYDLELVVHSPELFANDHTLDLCSINDEYRKTSIKELQRVIDVTNELKNYFPRTEKPVIITNVGGFTHDGFLTADQIKQRQEILVNSLSKLKLEGIEIIPQTMPPFPWHFGGQQYHNLFVGAEEIQTFCKDHNMRICLDTSHSKLACTHYNWSFYEFMEKTLPYTAHLHIADSLGAGGEGLQIQEGEIDFPIIVELIDKLCPNIGFIPEIWQGHENSGEGFWIALERLENLFNK